MPDKDRKAPEENPGSPMDQTPSTEEQPPQGSGRKHHVRQPKQRENPEDQGEDPQPGDPEHPSQQGFRGGGGGQGRAEDVEETARGE